MLGHLFFPHLVIALSGDQIILLLHKHKFFCPLLKIKAIWKQSDMLNGDSNWHLIA